MYGSVREEGTKSTYTLVQCKQYNITGCRTISAVCYTCRCSVLLFIIIDNILYYDDGVYKK